MRIKNNLKTFAKRFLTGVVVVVLSLVSLMKMMPSQDAYADQYDDKIAVLEQDIARYQAESDRLNSEAATLQTALAELSNQKASIQAQIDINQVKYNQLTQQIAETEKKITDSQDALGKTIADMYVSDDVTPIELLAGSSNISDYLDKQEYRSSVRDELASTIATIKELKASLVGQKADVEKILTDQKDQRDALAAKESEQQNLLAETQGQEDQYQQLISSSQAEIASARATQAAIAARFSDTGGYSLVDSGSLGDYPWNASNCPMEWYMSTGGSDGDGHDGGADGVGSDGYGCRQCASYVAWRVAKETGYYPYWGNAWQFTAGAQQSPWNGVEGAAQEGSIAVMDPATAGNGIYGHVAWVESVSEDGQRVLVSQYNYNYGAGYGMYSEMWLSVYAFDHYIHIL